MTLHAIVAALGGELSNGGGRATVAAPGHSPGDRSISLLLSGDRLVIHGFGATDWRTVRDHLTGLGLVGADGRIAATGVTAPWPSEARPDPRARVAAARRFWDGAGPIGAGCLSHRYLRGRAIGGNPAGIASLRHHAAAPVSAYRLGGPIRPAMVARITDPGGRMTAVEVVYLDPNGRRATGLRLSRKTVGCVPPGSAVRLAAAAGVMVVGEGVLTVLSAAERFGLPGWALMSARNLSAWTPPTGVVRVLIAADRGRVGERAAADLKARLSRLGVPASIALPAEPFEDWNAAAAGLARLTRGWP